MQRSDAVHQSLPSLGERVSRCLRWGLYTQLETLLRDAGAVVQLVTGERAMLNTVLAAAERGHLASVAPFIVDWLREEEVLAELQLAHETPLRGDRRVAQARVLLLRVFGPVRPDEHSVGHVTLVEEGAA